MKTFLLSILFVVIACFTCQAQDITGDWYGKPDMGAVVLRLKFQINQQDGVYQGALYSIDQGNHRINASKVSFSQDTLVVEVASINFVFTGVLEGEEVKGSFTQNAATFELVLSRMPFELNRPQEPTPPYPYKEEEVTFRNEKAGINLAGTLTLPENGKNFTAVVLVTGSGPQNRNEELSGHKPFLVLADYLTRQGFAVLRYDDRGVAQSEGTYRTATLQDHAEDAQAALEYLKQRKEINRKKVGVLGHSMGGTIAFILAADKTPAFVVSLAGVAVSGRDLIHTQQADILRASGAPNDFIASHVAIMEEAHDLVAKIDDNQLLREQLIELFKGTPLDGQVDAIGPNIASPEIKSLVAFDPKECLAKIKCPVLALNGEIDLQVHTEDNLTAIKNIAANGNKHVTTKAYPGLNHLFQPATTGLMDEYPKIEETISPEVLQDIATWLSKR